MDRQKKFLDAFTVRYGELNQSQSDPSQLNDGALLVGGRDVSLRDLGAVGLDYLEKEIEAAQFALRNTGDLLLTLARIDAAHQSPLRGGASINKAKELINASRFGANRQRLEKDWSKYRDVAHLAAATCYLAARGFSQTREVRNLTLMTPVFSDPDSLLCLARHFEEFALTIRPWGRNEGILSDETLGSPQISG